MGNTINAVSIIKTIANKLRDKKLKNIPSVEKEIASLSEYLGTDQMQTIIFVAIFDRTSSGSSSNVDDIARYFECSSLDIVEHKKEFDKLLFRGLIEKTRRCRAYSAGFTSADFRIPTVVFEAILCDEPLSNAKSSQNEPDHFELVKDIGELLEDRDSEDMSTSSFLSLAMEMEDIFSSCDFVKEVRRMLPDIVDRVLFYVICKDNFIDSNESDLEGTLKDLFDHRIQVLSEMKNFIKEKSTLQKCGLVECRQDDDEYKLKPTKSGYKLLLGEYAEIKMKQTTGLDKFEFVKAVSELIEDRKRNNYCNVILIIRNIFLIFMV